MAVQHRRHHYIPAGFHASINLLYFSFYLCTIAGMMRPAFQARQLGDAGDAGHAARDGCPSHRRMMTLPAPARCTYLNQVPHSLATHTTPIGGRAVGRALAGLSNSAAAARGRPQRPPHHWHAGTLHVSHAADPKTKSVRPRGATFEQIPNWGAAAQRAHNEIETRPAALRGAGPGRPVARPQGPKRDTKPGTHALAAAVPEGLPCAQQRRPSA